MAAILVKKKKSSQTRSFDVGPKCSLQTGLRITASSRKPDFTIVWVRHYNSYRLLLAMTHALSSVINNALLSRTLITLIHTATLPLAYRAQHILPLMRKIVPTSFLHLKHCPSRMPTTMIGCNAMATWMAMFVRLYLGLVPVLG